MVRQSRDLLVRYFRGFDDSNRTRQAANLPNHIAWTLGHLAITMHRTAERIDGQELPTSEFLTADGRGGDANRFDTEAVSFGSTPIDDPAIYPTWSRCLAIFDAAINRLAACSNLRMTRSSIRCRSGDRATFRPTRSRRGWSFTTAHIADKSRTCVCAPGIGSIFA